MFSLLLDRVPIDQRLTILHLNINGHGRADFHGIFREREHDGCVEESADALELRARARELEHLLRDVLDDGEESRARRASALRDDAVVLAADLELGHGGKQRLLGFGRNDLDSHELAAIFRVGENLELERISDALLNAFLHGRGEAEIERELRLILDDDEVVGLALHFGGAGLDDALVGVAGAEEVGDDPGVAVGGDDLGGHLLSGEVSVGDYLELDLHAGFDAVSEGGRDSPPEFALASVLADEGEEALLAFLRILLDLTGVLLSLVELDDDEVGVWFFVSWCGGC